MTKNIFITAVAVLLSVALCPLWAQNVSEDCKVGEFSAINLRSVGNIIFTQSDRSEEHTSEPSHIIPSRMPSSA